MDDPNDVLCELLKKIHSGIDDAVTGSEKVNRLLAAIRAEGCEVTIQIDTCIDLQSILPALPPPGPDEKLLNSIRDLDSDATDPGPQANE